MATLSTDCQLGLCTPKQKSYTCTIIFFCHITVHRQKYSTSVRASCYNRGRGASARGAGGGPAADWLQILLIVARILFGSLQRVSTQVEKYTRSYKKCRQHGKDMHGVFICIVMHPYGSACLHYTHDRTNFDTYGKKTRSTPTATSLDECKCGFSSASVGPCMHIYIYIHIHIYIYIDICMNMYVHIYIHMCA